MLFKKKKDEEILFQEKLKEYLEENKSEIIESKKYKELETEKNNLKRQLKAIEDKGDIYTKLLTAFRCTRQLDLTGPEVEYSNTYYCSLSEYGYQLMKESLEKARKYDELQKEIIDENKATMKKKMKAKMENK